MNLNDLDEFNQFYLNDFLDKLFEKKQDCFPPWRL